MACSAGDDLFDISPALVVNEAVFSIRVKNHLALDYERLNATDCTVTATEALPGRQAKSASVPVAIRIRDVNDNIPQFTRSSYKVVFASVSQASCSALLKLPDRTQVQVAENAPVGTVIGSVRATDEDSGEFGTGGIRYSLLPGSIADALAIDPLTGAVSIGRAGSSVLDREKVSQLIVMVEARDSLGSGNRYARRHLQKLGRQFRVKAAPIMLDFTTADPA